MPLLLPCCPCCLSTVKVPTQPLSSIFVDVFLSCTCTSTYPMLASFCSSVVRIIAIVAVYGDGTIAPFNGTTITRRRLLRTQIGIQVNYYVTTTQSQALTKVMLTQNSTRAAMSIALANTVPNAVLSWPRFGDTSPPSFAPSPAPTVKSIVFTVGALVAVCVLGGSLCIAGIVVLVFYGNYRRMKYNAAYLEPPVVVNYDTPFPPPSPGSPAGVIDVERGEGLFQRPRLVQMVHQHTQTMVNQHTQTDNNNTDSSDIKEDDSDKDSEFSSIAISMTEEVIATSSPSTMLFKSGKSSSVIGVSSSDDETGKSKSKSKSKGGKSSTSKSTVPLVPKSIVVSPSKKLPEVVVVALDALATIDIVPTKAGSPHAPLVDKETNDEGKNDVLKTNPRAATNNTAAAAVAAERQIPKKKTFQTLELTETENSSINKVERPPALNIHDAFKDLFSDDVPPPPSRSSSQPSGILPPKSEPNNVPIQQSQKPIDFSLPLPRIIVNFHGLESNDDSHRLDHDDLSLVYRNDEEDQDLHLSTVYKQHTEWEDEEGVILSTNPAWLKLLDGDSITATLPLDHGQSQDSQNPPSTDSNNLPVSASSSSSVRMSGKSYEGDEGRFRRKQSFMTVDSDVVAVKAGETYFLLHTLVHILITYLLTYLFAYALTHPPPSLLTLVPPPLHLSGGAYFPAAAAYVAAAAAAASAATPTRGSHPLRSDSGSSNSHGWAKTPAPSSSTQQFAPHPSARHPLSADDLFNKQLKKAADDFIPEHTIEEAEAPKSTPVSLQQSPPLRTTSKAFRQESRNDREHAAINLSSVYVGESITYEDNFTNPQWTKLVDRLNKIPQNDNKKDEIPAVPVFKGPRISVRESNEKNTEENEDKPSTFNRPRK